MPSPTPTRSASLHRYVHVSTPRARLVCFPHAGGSASFFRPWVEALGSDMELVAVQYPGREDRMRDPFARDIPTLANQVVTELVGLSDVPLALLGHSLGAAVAYESARLLQAGDAPSPLLLFVSGREAPREHNRPLHLMSDDELWDDIRRAGGTSEELLSDPAVRAVYLPVLRADYMLSETYDPVGAELLHAPIVALNGTEDPDVDLGVVTGWGELSTQPLQRREFVGGHFYLRHHLDAVVAEVRSRIIERLEVTDDD